MILAINLVPVPLGMCFRTVFETGFTFVGSAGSLQRGDARITRRQLLLEALVVVAVPLKTTIILSFLQAKLVWIVES